MKWFIKCFKQYTDFSGRARRKEYWWFSLINFIVVLVIFTGLCIPLFKMGFDAATTGVEDIDETEMMLTILKSPFMYIYIIYSLATLIPGIAVTVRRLHDIGKSGYWAIFIYGCALLNYIGQLLQTTSTVAYFLFVLIALAIGIISLVWMFTNSDYGPNQYGPNPKDEGNDIPQEQEPIPTV